MYPPLTYSVPVYQPPQVYRPMTKSMIANQLPMNNSMKPLYNFRSKTKQIPSQEKESQSFTPIKIKNPTQFNTPSTNYIFSDSKISQRNQIPIEKYYLPNSGKKSQTQHSPFQRCQQQQQITQQCYQHNFQTRDVSPARILFKSGYDFQEGIKKLREENKTLNEVCNDLSVKLQGVAEYHEQYVDYTQMKEKINQFNQQYKLLLTQNDNLMKKLEILQKDVNETERIIEIQTGRYSPNQQHQEQFSNKDHEYDEQ